MDTKEKIESALKQPFLNQFMSGKEKIIELDRGASLVEVNGDIKLRVEIDFDESNLSETITYLRNKFEEPIRSIEDTLYQIISEGDFKDE